VVLRINSAGVARTPRSACHAEKAPGCDLDHTKRSAWVVFLAPVEQELTPMTPHVWTRKRLMLSVAIVALAAIAAALSIGLAYPEPVSSAALGPDWQCTRLAFVLTTCTRLVRAETAYAGTREDPACRSRPRTSSARRASD